MHAREFVELSEKLALQGKAGARSAVSRAYYGVFHLAIGALEEIATAPPANGKSHNLVPKYLKSANHPDGNAAGNLLADLHSNRLRADYRLDYTEVESVVFAKLNVEIAHAIVAKLDSFIAACRADDNTRLALVNGIAELRKTYRI